MSITFTEPDKERGKLLIALAGASGTGKTFSAMELATGLSGDKPFAFIDTESGRAKHYRDSFNFRHGDLAAPFSPVAYKAAVRAAIDQGFETIVIDSMSHEHEGEGGLCEMAEKSSRNGPGAWEKPKQLHKQMMSAFLGSPAHLIFCLRADEKLDLSQKDDRGKVIVKNKGWTPICEKRFMYEMTISFTLTPSRPGVVDLRFPHKLQDQHRLAFMPGEHITREGGDFLRRWSEGEDVPLPDKALWDSARKISREGVEQLKRYWHDVADPDQKAKLKPIVWELHQNAQEADRMAAQTKAAGLE